MVAMLIGSAMPAFAAPSFTPGECNAGDGNGAETILDGDGNVTECDPGNSGTTPAVDNDALPPPPPPPPPPPCDPKVDDCEPAGND
jgi:hypothetical protein